VLLDAYQHGIFPWPMWDGDLPMLWWSPDPRGVIEFDRFHVSRRLARTIRSGQFRVTSDEDFAGVLRGCATARGRRGSTWLTDEMMQAYQELHRLGHAHSVEVWLDGRLAGGIYGVTIGGLFAGESMFHRVRDASKVALASLVEHVEAQGFRLFDIQQINPHTRSMGGSEIPRRVYLRRLSDVVSLDVEFGRIEEEV
jgi:leucyl/phenylalanyl-tRNA--protein transferase